MKKNSYLFASSLIGASLLLCSCSGTSDFYSTSHNSVGSVGQTLTGTVTSATLVKSEASQGAKAAGALIGTAVGAGTGQMLGGGSGRVVSTVGFGVLGGILGDQIASGVASGYAQRLTIKTTSGRSYTITQPVYEQFGEIAVGTRGNLTLSNGNNSRFEPTN